MKNPLKVTVSSLLVTAIAAVSIVGCAGSKNSGPGNDAALVANWLLTSIATKNPVGGPAACQPAGATLPLNDGSNIGCGSDYRVHFKADGTWNNNAVPQTTGTWMTEGDKLTLKSAGNADENYIYSVAGSNATLKINVGGSEVTLTVAKV